jgi:RNA polymerase sigma factor (sigma-70 family)
MADETHAAELLARWQQGDQQAAAELFRRYARQLIAVAQNRLSARLASRIDPEDVVQSAYRSFFVGVRNGEYDVQKSGELWHLLVGITVHKLRHQIRRNLADKRSVEREQSLDGEGARPALADLLGQEPSPLDAVVLVDEVERLMRRLEPVPRRMLELRLQGYDLREIAIETGRSYRTVRRTLDGVKRRLEQGYPEVGQFPGG